MFRTGSPARYLFVCAALVGLSGASTYTAPMVPPGNTAAGVVCRPSTGHCYKYFPGTLDWHTAKAAAEVSTHNGVRGHLVTITSAAESAFIVANLSDAIVNNAWIGAYHFGNDNLLDGWEWVTGEPWDYTNWASVAPNQWSERAGLFWHGNGTWNDGHETANWPGGYLVEYPAKLPSDLIIGKAGEFNHKGNVAMLFDDGAGGFTMDKIELNVFEQDHEVAAGDVNNDGRDDVVVVYSRGQAWVALGGFSDGLQNSDLVSAGSFTDNLHPSIGHNRTRVLKLADVNDDGNLDIVVTLWAHLAVKLGNGDGTFGAEILTGAAAFDARGMAVGDLDGDGKADLVAAHAAGIWQLVFYRGNGNGTFQTGSSVFGSLNAIPNIFLRNADGDDDLDIYTGGLGARASIFINNGAASFTKTDLDPGTGMQGTLLVVDDLNGDGTPDVVAGTEANNYTNVRVWLSNGSGGFTAADYGPVGSQPRHGAVGDFNQDGIKDIAMVTVAIFGGNPGSLWTMRGNGNGTFQAPTQPIATYRNNYTIAAGNFKTAVPVVVACLAGTYSVTGNAPCTQADPGYYVSGAGATSQTACEIGSYSSVAGATTCMLAPAGSYVDTTGATGPLTCDAGSFSATDGASSCTLAAPGFFVPLIGQTFQTACAAGYGSDAGAIACYALDNDGDGVNNDDDAYPDSNMGMTVSLGACVTTVANQVMPNGATFNDLLATASAGATNHGKRVSAVTQLSNGWKNAGLISGRDHGAITSCVARSK